jgi:hypothetical protein
MYNAFHLQLEIKSKRRNTQYLFYAINVNYNMAYGLKMKKGYLQDKPTEKCFSFLGGGGR